ncbi:hypothetical protein [Streptomyces syringium]|uniref:hypothetical protein n=1 Tax=Streptomyces syringium TaxID=76729 RepID=UPI00343D0662
MALRRTDAHRLGMAVQICTARAARACHLRVLGRGPGAGEPWWGGLLAGVGCGPGNVGREAVMSGGAAGIGSEGPGTPFGMAIQTPVALANQVVQAGEGAKITPDMVQSAQKILNANEEAGN